MRSRQEMARALSMLRPMVQNQDFAKIDSFAAEWGLEFLVSNEFIDFSRRVKDPGSVIFLATLAAHNAQKAARPQMILQAYQSIAAGDLTHGIAQLPERHVLRQTIAALATKTAIPAARLDSYKRKGTGQEWMLALELCLDHGAIADALSLFQEHVRSASSDEFVLLCAKGLIERSSGVRLSDSMPWADWIALQSAVYNELKHRKNETNADLIAQMAGEYCHFAQDHTGSIAWYQKIGPGSEKSVICQYHIARAHGHLNEFGVCIAEMDDALHRICHKSNDWINENFLHADADGEKASNASFNTGAAAAALKDLQTVLAEVGMAPFLVSGTLLGYARNRGFLSHDKDVDVGIFASQSIFEVVNLLTRSGLFSVHFNYLRLEETYQVPVVHRQSGMSIDIFVYYPQGDKLVTGVQSNFGYTQNFAFTPFALKTVQFLDIDFSIPADMALNLQENFGPWQVPDPHFISHLECPTTVDIGGVVYMLVARLEMLRSLVEGKKVKVDRIANILRRWPDAKHAMAPTLVDRLQSRFGTDSVESSAALELMDFSHA